MQLWLFAGRSTSESPACVADHSVTVFEIKKGKDSKLGSDTTDDAGKYSLNEKKAKGMFYASVKETSTSETCLAAKSKTIKVG